MVASRGRISRPSAHDLVLARPNLEERNRGVFREPLTRPALHEPEVQNLLRLFPLAVHQSRACTLATLSSRVWSLSVRVLIFTVV